MTPRWAGRGIASPRRPRPRSEARLARSAREVSRTPVRPASVSVHASGDGPRVSEHDLDRHTLLCGVLLLGRRSALLADGPGMLERRVTGPTSLAANPAAWLAPGTRTVESSWCNTSLWHRSTQTPDGYPLHARERMDESACCLRVELGRMRGKWRLSFATLPGRRSSDADEAGARWISNKDRHEPGLSSCVLANNRVWMPA